MQAISKHATTTRKLSLAKRITRAIYARFGYVVNVPEYRANHYTLSLSDAIEWTQCYPSNTAVFFANRGVCLDVCLTLDKSDVSRIQFA